jgi:hypothetical protein
MSTCPPAVFSSPATGVKIDLIPEKNLYPVPDLPGKAADAKDNIFLGEESMVLDRFAEFGTNRFPSRKK